MSFTLHGDSICFVCGTSADGLEEDQLGKAGWSVRILPIKGSNVTLCPNCPVEDAMAVARIVYLEEKFRNKECDLPADIWRRTRQNKTTVTTCSALQYSRRDVCWRIHLLAGNLFTLRVDEFTDGRNPWFPKDHKGFLEPVDQKILDLLQQSGVPAEMCPNLCGSG